MTGAKQRRSLEEAIVDTVREPLIVLDDALRVVIASRSFYRAFGVAPQESEGRLFYELGHGQWDIPALRELLTEIIPHRTTIEGFEVEHDFPIIGRKIMLLNARRVFYEGNNSTSLLVAIEDVTERRALEREKDELLRQKDLLLQEMNHRINNSLQIIASILLLKAHAVQSEETRRHLQDAHERVMSVAAVQEQLHPTPFGAQIEAKSYLTKLCESLAASMIVDDQPVSIRVEAGEGSDVAQTSWPMPASTSASNKAITSFSMTSTRRASRPSGAHALYASAIQMRVSEMRSPPPLPLSFEILQAPDEAKHQ